MNPDRAARLHGAVDRDSGELFTFTGRKFAFDVDSPRVADSARPAFDVTGVWSGPSRTFYPHARGVSSDHAQQRIASKPSVKVDIALLSWSPVTGDLAVRQIDSSTYEIGEVLPDGFGRLVLMLTAKQ